MSEQRPPYTPQSRIRSGEAGRFFDEFFGEGWDRPVGTLDEFIDGASKQEYFIPETPIYDELRRTGRLPGPCRVCEIVGFDCGRHGP